MTDYPGRGGYAPPMTPAARLSAARLSEVERLRVEVAIRGLMLEAMAAASDPDKPGECIAKEREAAIERLKRITG